MLMRKLFVFIIILLGTCSRPPTLLEEILQQGELRVVTRNSPTSYYMGAHGPEGPEYDLIRGFATFIGVKLNIYEAERFSDVIPEVVNGNAHIAAAGLSVTKERLRKVDFGPAYEKVEQQLIYRRGSYRPRNISELIGKRLEVAPGTSYIDTMQDLQAEMPEFSWIENPSSDVSDLLMDVANGTIDYTVADSTIVSIYQNFMPEIRVAMTLSEGDSLAWAFQKRQDKSLIKEAKRYFAYIEENGDLQRIKERYYRHSHAFDYVGTRTFRRHIEQRLGNYQNTFVDAENSTGIDWRLLAALSYQESHWDAEAVSPTGVRGLMMLTQNTANVLGVTDRIDPEQSIRGGAEYLEQLKERISPEIREPDRTWLALAAYNVGYGHLSDAQEIVRQQRGNPNSWLDVKQALPLLAKRKYYSEATYGYARGWEPVKYVENIRTYYRIMQWLSADDPEALQPGSEEIETIT
jgi:membrane-bound lytic murein transglycosylase F